MRCPATLLRTTVVICIGSFAAASAGAQTAAMKLPAELSGRFVYLDLNRPWSLTIDKRGADDTFEGRVTYPGRACFAKNAPVKEATLKDDELRFVVDMDGCPGMQFTMKKSGGHLFQGEIRNPSFPAAGATSVYLD